MYGAAGSEMHQGDGCSHEEVWWGVLFMTIVAWRGNRRGGTKQMESCVFQEDMNEITNLLCDRKGNIPEWDLGNDGIQSTVCEAWADRSLQNPQGAWVPSLLHSLWEVEGEAGLTLAPGGILSRGAGDRAPHNTCNHQGVLAGAYGAVVPQQQQAAELPLCYFYLEFCSHEKNVQKWLMNWN